MVIAVFCFNFIAEAIAKISFGYDEGNLSAAKKRLNLNLTLFQGPHVVAATPVINI